MPVEQQLDINVDSVKALGGRVEMPLEVLIAGCQALLNRQHGPDTGARHRSLYRGGYAKFKTMQDRLGHRSQPAADGPADATLTSHHRPLCIGTVMTSAS